MWRPTMQRIYENKLLNLGCCGKTRHERMWIIIDRTTEREMEPTPCLRVSPDPASISQLTRLGRTCDGSIATVKVTGKSIVY